MTSTEHNTTPDDSTAGKFERFHAESPEVYRTLVALARQWVVRTGRARIGIATLYERARWELAISTSDPDFKLNNTYRAYYARLIMLQERNLEHLFEVRSSEADEWLDDARATYAQRVDGALSKLRAL
jgi:hypothetical protein